MQSNPEKIGTPKITFSMCLLQLVFQYCFWRFIITENEFMERFFERVRVKCLCTYKFCYEKRKLSGCPFRKNCLEFFGSTAAVVTLQMLLNLIVKIASLEKLLVIKCHMFVDFLLCFVEYSEFSSKCFSEKINFSNIRELTTLPKFNRVRVVQKN